MPKPHIDLNTLLSQLEALSVYFEMNQEDFMTGREILLMIKKILQDSVIKEDE